jgi:hypothetical protein
MVVHHLIAILSLIIDVSSSTDTPNTQVSVPLAINVVNMKDNPKKVIVAEAAKNIPTVDVKIEKAKLYLHNNSIQIQRSTEYFSSKSHELNIKIERSGTNQSIYDHRSIEKASNQNSAIPAVP